MSVQDNIAALKAAIAKVQEHPMCLKFEEHKDKFLVLYPAGMFPDGAQARFATGGKVVALNRLLDAMERHWVANGIQATIQL